jgi:hypothetical protein
MNIIPEITITPELAKMQEIVPTLVARAKAFEVTTDEQYENGSQVLGYLKTQTTSLDKLRKHFKAPILESGKRIDAFFKELTAPAKEAIEIVNDKMGVWWRIKDEERKKAEEQARIAERDRMKAEEERERIQKDMEAEGVEVDEEDLPPVPEAVIVPDAPVASSTSVRKTWSYAVEDADKIPRIYLVQSNKLIMQSIHDGVREIPGLNIFQEVNFSKKRSV